MEGYKPPVDLDTAGGREVQVGGGRRRRIGAAAGLAVSLLLRLGGGEPMLGLPAWIPYPLEEDGASHFPVRTFAMLSGLSTIWLVSRCTRSFDPPRLLTIPESADSV